MTLAPDTLLICTLNAFDTLDTLGTQRNIYTHLNIGIYNLHTLEDTTYIHSQTRETSVYMDIHSTYTIYIHLQIQLVHPHFAISLYAQYTIYIYNLHTPESRTIAAMSHDSGDVVRQRRCRTIAAMLHDCMLQQLGSTCPKTGYSYMQCCGRACRSSGSAYIKGTPRHSPHTLAIRSCSSKTNS